MTKELKPKSISTTPHTVDFNVNGACNLDCPWCWGPEHNAPESVSINQWQEIATSLSRLGTRSIVFTGGEPLMRAGLNELAAFVHEDLGLRTTLSTNGILLKSRGPAILPYIDDIGIPLDGPNQIENQQMRVGTPIHFRRALGAIKLIQEDYPNIELTVRTVVSKLNRHSVALIGQTLIDTDIDPSKLRWKLYQYRPSGPRVSQSTTESFAISSEQFDETINQVRITNPQFNIQPQSISNSFGRYVHIMPDGKTFIIIRDSNNLPIELGLGNFVASSEEVMQNLNKSLDLANNLFHGIAREGSARGKGST